MKLKNEDVANLFAQNALTMQANDAHGNGAIFIDGRTIYSYGKHHPIATIISQGVVKFNTDRYSNTTSKQASQVRSALTKANVRIELYSNREELLDKDGDDMIKKKLKYQEDHTLRKLRLDVSEAMGE